MFIQKHAAKLGEAVGRVFDRRQGDGTVVDRKCEQLHVVGECAFETMSNLVGAGADPEGVLTPPTLPRLRV